MTLNHDSKESIRTIDSIISIVLQLIAVGIQGFGLWYIMNHPH